MSIETKHYVVCDRCKKTIKQTSQHELNSVGPSRASQTPIVGCRFMSHGEVGGFDFHDLCDKCDNRVSNLLALMEMRQEEDSVVIPSYPDEVDSTTASENHSENGTPQSDQVL